MRKNVSGFCAKSRNKRNKRTKVYKNAELLKKKMQKKLETKKEPREGSRPAKGFDNPANHGYGEGGECMEKQKKAVARLISTTLSNVAVIGFGLAIYENRPLALIAGIIAMGIAGILTWRTER